MHDDEEIWFRIGYAVERARQKIPESHPQSSAGRAPLRKGGGRAAEHSGSRGDMLGSVLSMGVGSVAAHLLRLAAAPSSPGAGAHLRAGGAGAGTALLVEILRPLATGERYPSRAAALLEAALAGAAHGLVYASLERLAFGAPCRAGGSQLSALRRTLSADCYLSGSGNTRRGMEEGE